MNVQHQVSLNHCVAIYLFQPVEMWIIGLSNHEIMPALFFFFLSLVKVDNQNQINLLPGYNLLFYYIPNALQLYIYPRLLSICARVMEFERCSRDFHRKSSNEQYICHENGV